MAKTNVEKALETAFNYAQIDGDHHKLWVIDQMIHDLLETEEAYDDWVTAYEEPDSEGTIQYEWDSGIAP